MINHKKQGKKNKRMGADFERRVRKDLEEKGWIVSKWQNNLKYSKEKEDFKCIPAKPGRFRMMQTGFPDFFVYKMYDEEENFLDTGAIPKTRPIKIFKIIFVECKTNGYLSKEEKEKAQWYLKNNYCEEFLIAKKIKNGRKVGVKYAVFER